MKRLSGLRRLLCLALCLVMLLALAACGEKEEPAEAPVDGPQEAEPTPEPTPEPIKDNDCTAKVGETLPLSVVCTPGGISGEVVWSVDKICEGSFELTVNEGDPYRANLKCVSVLPDGAGGAKNSAGDGAFAAEKVGFSRSGNEPIQHAR